MVNVGGKLRKNGGNVASYFCTPDARVIHAVGKPVSGARLLKEAAWAVNTYERILAKAPKRLRTQAKLLQQAHLAELNTTLAAFDQQYRRELPESRKAVIEKVQEIAKRRSQRREYSHDPVVPAEVEARRRAVRHFRGSKSHQILAAEPLASFSHISRRLFEELTGEKYAQRRSRVFSASAGLKLAREQSKPVLLILYRGHGKYRDELDKSTTQWLQKITRQTPVVQPLRHFVVVTLPLRELAALSNLSDQPAYELPRRSRVSLVLANPDGRQAGVLDDSASPHQLAAAMWPILAESAIGRAKKLTADGKHSAAIRLLRQLTRAPIDRQMMERLSQQVVATRFAMAEAWANAGKTRNALAQYRLVVDKASDDEMRKRAQRRIASLQ